MMAERFRILHLGDRGVELSGPRRFDIPIPFSDQQHLFGSRRVRGAHQRAHIVLLGDIPRRDRHRPQAPPVLVAPALSPREPSFHSEPVLEVRHIQERDISNLSSTAIQPTVSPHETVG